MAVKEQRRSNYPECPNRIDGTGYPDKEKVDTFSYAAALGYNTQASVARQAPQPPRGYTPAEDAPRQRIATPVFGAKDHVVAGLLAIFLGALGIHKFYLGYNKAAFITLAVTVLGSIFTFGLAANVMWIIAIIEGIIYLSKSQTEFEQLYVFSSKEWF